MSKSFKNLIVYLDDRLLVIDKVDLVVRTCNLLDTAVDLVVDIL